MMLTAGGGVDVHQLSGEDFHVTTVSQGSNGPISVDRDNAEAS
jgi:hypothetical protein